jgi:hypothetical protein
MAPDQLRALLRVTPFRPFKVYMASGHSYVVAGPEWFIVGFPTSALGVPGKSGDGELIHLIDTMSITHTEPVGSSPAPK